MKVSEIMTARPVCCTLETQLQEVARLMLEKDCGEIPVVESHEKLRPIGVITDRDIVCRSLAVGKDPFDLRAEDVMTKTVITVTPDTTLDEVCQIMEENQIRRVPVVDQNGEICGMLTQADIARHLSEGKAAEVLRFVSQPSARAAGD